MPSYAMSLLDAAFANAMEQEDPSLAEQIFVHTITDMPWGQWVSFKEALEPQFGTPTKRTFLWSSALRETRFFMDEGLSLAEKEVRFWIAETPTDHFKAWSINFENRG